MCLTLERACEWLGLRGVSLQPLALLEEAAKGRIPIFAGIPEGAYSGPVGQSTAQPEELLEMLKLFGHDVAEAPKWRMFSLVEGRRFRKGEMMPVTPDDCLQFLQTGEAHIYGKGGQEWIDAGLPDDWAVELKVLDIEAFRVKGCDLEAFEVAASKKATTSASIVPLPAPETVAPAPAGAGGELPVQSTRTATRHRREDLLTPAIDTAKAGCANPGSASEVFARLQAMARMAVPTPPLLGVTDGGVQWIDSNDTPRELNLEALRKRLGRANVS